MRKCFFSFFFSDQSFADQSPFKKKQGFAFGNVKGILFPSFGIGEKGGISVNFGKSTFAYNIQAHDWAVGESAAAVAVDHSGFGRMMRRN